MTSASRQTKLGFTSSFFIVAIGSCAVVPILFSRHISSVTSVLHTLLVTLFGFGKIWTRLNLVTCHTTLSFTPASPSFHMSWLDTKTMSLFANAVFASLLVSFPFHLPTSTMFLCTALCRVYLPHRISNSISRCIYVPTLCRKCTNNLKAP